jgi:predicted nucleic acid-binding protein
MALLLDTNVLSELRRPRPEPKVLEFIAEQDIEQLYVSVVTLAELRFGIELIVEPARRQALADWLAHTVRPMFEDRTLALTEDILLRWRVLIEAGRKLGHTFSQPDVLIAATAAHHGLRVVSRDSSGFLKAGVAVINPWD